MIDRSTSDVLVATHVLLNVCRWLSPGFISNSFCCAPWLVWTADSRLVHLSMMKSEWMMLFLFQTRLVDPMDVDWGVWDRWKKKCGERAVKVQAWLLKRGRVGAPPSPSLLTNHPPCWRSSVECVWWCYHVGFGWMSWFDKCRWRIGDWAAAFCFAVSTTSSNTTTHSLLLFQCVHASHYDHCQVLAWLNWPETVVVGVGGVFVAGDHSSCFLCCCCWLWWPSAYFLLVPTLPIPLLTCTEGADHLCSLLLQE